MYGRRFDRVLLMSAKKLAFGAILTALSVALLWIGSVLPTGRIALVALASLLPAAAVLHSGLPLSFLVYAASALLSILILPDKTCAVAYALVLGWYGAVKSLIERLDSVVLEWVIKIALFAAVSCLFYFVFTAMFLSLISLSAMPFAWLIIPVLLVAFVLYDVAFSGLIGMYQERVAKHIRF